jgi:hypothetical protein
MLHWKSHYLAGTSWRSLPVFFFSIIKNQRIQRLRAGRKDTDPPGISV